MTKHLTCVDLPFGAQYKFHPDVIEAHPGLSTDTYERRDNHSVVVTGPFKGNTVQWYGHEKTRIVEVGKPQVLPASSVPPVTVKREVLTIDKIGVGQTFIVHGKPDEVYVKISNSHVFNHKRLQMHTTVSERFKSHLNLVIVELVVYNGK